VLEEARSGWSIDGHECRLWLHRRADLDHVRRGGHDGFARGWFRCGRHRRLGSTCSCGALYLRLAGVRWYGVQHGNNANQVKAKALRRLQKDAAALVRRLAGVALM